MGKRNITPHQAKEWLNNNNKTNYRPLREDLGRRYARDMLAGSWHDTGDPIAFDVDGQLQNGQHRLFAITVANIDVRLTVETNKPYELRDYYDLHKKRTMGNILAARGIKNGVAVASAKRLQLDFIGMRQGRGAIGRYASEAEILKMIDADEILLWVVENISSKNLVPRKVCNQTVAIACYTDLHAIDPYACAEFFSLMVEPVNLDKDHPIMALHRKFTQGSWPGRGRMLRLQQASVIFRAWNAWRGGEDRDHFKSNVTNDEKKLVIPEPTKDTVLDHTRPQETD